MTRVWFRRWGWVYRPVSVPGVVIVALAAIASVQVFLAVDRHSHSVSDTLYGIVPYIVPCWMLVNWVASNSSDSARGGRSPSPAGRPDGPRP